ncbi:DUF4202 domain-containing protein [Aquimarina sp. TRL1]|uniref:DUF4202 domain-containing protein n=1 Tax=Aquimarina sp. (strain TRL1) TaxID=2736252 RepID=UPI00158DB25E|nr:DUF4202 domain-containing protein [Aquimarina sp. TRL1]QKX07376.1 DUF4202 domain-containing protein [Aquimarina sp. TRL1]
MSISLLETAYQLFDEANAKDPNQEIVEGKEIPKELIYGQRMTQTLSSFQPDASEVVKLACRCQHICRWEIPRDSYPMDRVGYLRWREELKKFHATKAAGILEKVGYTQDVIDRVSFLLQKKKLKKDPESQLLEDVICLVFLAFYYEPFIAKHEEKKVVSILQKTWNKMSEKGHEAALKLSFSEKGLHLIKIALS